ncbi:MAG: hypothetical protein LBL37_08340, partial [Gracilibacteraceae bacterium]|nr:hypothetical protein [Gracilibacteraceae bacterium]
NAYNFTGYGYNDFEIEYTIDEDMWAVLSLSYDPNWKFTLLADEQTNSLKRELPGEQANVTLTAVYLPAGAHKLLIEYRPFARSLYPVAAVFLLGTLFFCGVEWKPKKKAKI